jgi:hypothetical protein
MFGWFKKSQSTAPANDAANEPPGEADKVLRVRGLCETGKWSARYLREGGLNDEMRAYEAGVYAKRKEAALELARELTDEFYRDAALHSIIELCVEGREVDYARKLLDVIEVAIIRQKILTAYPYLSKDHKPVF